MKDNNDIKDYSDYYKGHRIASQIGDVMQGDDTLHQELDEWLSDTEHSAEVAERLSSEETLTKICNNFEREEKYSSSKRLTATLKKKRTKSFKIKFIRIASASCAAALLAISFLLFNDSESEKMHNNLTSTMTTGTIKTDFVKPTLILSSGQNIDLTTISATHLTDVKETTLPVDTVIFNRIVIPKEYNYSVELEDGTTVHLNANSELRYPVKFTGEKREVYLTGEALFEVKKGSKPFIVNINNLLVRVYGTKFNVNSYNSDNIQTMLIEGSVSVRQQNDTVETFIKPNQLLTINDKGDRTITNATPQRYISWTTGYICNDEEPMSNLLDNIAKWYGVEFLYNKEVKKININASLNRTRPLEEILEAIETISGLKITKQEEGKYMVR